MPDRWDNSNLEEDGNEKSEAETQEPEKLSEEKVNSLLEAAVGTAG